MIQIVEYPKKKTWDTLFSRPQLVSESLGSIVKNILDDVRTNGDVAVMKYTLKFDQAKPTQFIYELKGLSIENLGLPHQLIMAMEIAYNNIWNFHQAQREKTLSVETCKGVNCYRKSVPIEKVGLYIPGGTAPLLSTVLMLAIPAKIAGCQEVVVCTPPNPNGTIPKEIIAACLLCDIDKVYLVGGAQAIAAMAYGTETIPKVFKIFGPGNQYVTMAKKIVSLDNVAIDLPAGPSELVIWLDESSHTAFVAADLLSQAEHGHDSQVIAVSKHLHLLVEVNQEIKRQMPSHRRKQYISSSLKNSYLVLVKSEDEGIELINYYAPEHLIIATNQPERIAEKIINVGSVFLGHFTPESAGDYASGTNHTLPTNGTAVAYSGVALDSFEKKITLQKITPEGIQSIGKHIEALAEAEKLYAHKNAVSLRLDYLSKKDI